MQRVIWIICIAVAAVGSAGSAVRAEGSGESNRADSPQQWLWEIEGLTRTPVDLSGSLGVSFFGMEADGRQTLIDADQAGLTTHVRSTLDFHPQAIEGGFRIAGGIGWEGNRTLIEPALGFWGNVPLGGGRGDRTRTILDSNDASVDESGFTKLQVDDGWDLGIGTQFTWTIPDDAPVVGGAFGGLPVVFFPYVGVSRAEWDLRTVLSDDGSTSRFDEHFDKTLFLVGFDLDLPLPGLRGPLTHGLSFGFRWVDSGGNHRDDIGTGEDASGAFPLGDVYRSSFDQFHGWRVGLAYRVTWNDIGGFIARNFIDR